MFHLGIEEGFEGAGNRAVRDRTFTQSHLVDIGVVIERIAESPADVDIGEEVGRDAVAVQLAAAEQIVVLGIDVLDEEHGGVVHPGQFPENGHIRFHRFNLGQVFGGHIDGIGLALLQHEFSGIELGYAVIDDDGFDLGLTAPIAFESLEGMDLGGLIPFDMDIGSGTHLFIEEGLLLFGKVMPFGPGFGFPVPVTVSDHPFLVEDR